MKYVILIAAIVVSVVTGLGLIGSWGYFVGAALAMGAVLMRSKTKIVKTPQSVVPVELEKKKQLAEKIKIIKEHAEIRDNESAKKLAEREKKFEKDSQSPPSVIDIRDKLESIRSGKKSN